jgi:hypothetical protein
MPNDGTEPLPWDTATADEVIQDIRDAKAAGFEKLTEPGLDPEESVDFAGFIASLSEEFDEQCTARHKHGAEKYGAGKFLTVDTLEEAMQEIVDLSNYARYTYIRLRLLQESILAAVPTDAPVAQTGFIKATDFTKLGKANT